MSDQKVTVCRIVLYRLSESDVEQIETLRTYRPGVLQSRGNAPHVGDVFPAIVVRVFDDGSANLQVMLDGPDTHWVTSRRRDETDRGCWYWPPRAGS
jgi:hypothetical protein